LNNYQFTKKYYFMNWFLAKMVYRIICGDGDHKPQFDEQLRLIKAHDEFHAFQKAQLIGEREQDDFLNAAQKPVLWKFINVSELQKLEDLIDGAEMYSKICEEEDADFFIRVTHLKAARILENSMNKSLYLN
jgi:hypothetical protein